MPTLRPFRSLGYALERFAVSSRPGTRVADLSPVVCPPYDVISPAMQAELMARHPRNAVRLELSAEPDPHAAAASALAAWIDEGTLARRKAASAYLYRHARPADPDTPSVRGVLARVQLEPFGEGIRAHEHTMDGPKADRLALLRATRTQLSPILAIYFDPSPAYDGLLDGYSSDAWEARDADGLLHSLAAVDGDEQLMAYLGRQQLYVADGHHRYETALAYQAAVRADPRWADAERGSLAADHVMAVVVNAAREELEVQATHRLITTADDDALRSIVRDADSIWRSTPVLPRELAARLDELGASDQPVFGLVLPGDDGHLLVVDAEAAANRMRRTGMSAAVQRLDLAILHACVLEDRLGIDPAAVAAGAGLAYTRSASDAIRAVSSGGAKAAILVRPTRLEDLATVAGAGDVMPQKSTYFHPKLLTGLAFYPLEDD